MGYLVNHNSKSLTDSYRRYSVVAFLLIIAFNYLNFNLYGRHEVLLLVGRLASALILTFLIIKRPKIRIIELTFLFLALLSFIFSRFENLIPINLIFIITFVIATRDVPIKNLTDYCFFTCCLSLFVVMISIQLGFTENVIDSSGGRGRIRSTFGFSNTNGFSGLVIATVLLGLLRADRVKNRLGYFAVLVSLALYLFIETDSRTLIAVVLLYCFLIAVFFIMKNSFVLRFVALLIVTIPVLVVNMLPFILKVAPEIDYFLSFRITYAVSFLSGTTDWALFFGGSSSGSHNTDMGLVVTQSSMGIIFLALLMFLVFVVLVRAVSLRLHNIFAFIATFWLFSLSESSIVRPETIIALVFWILLVRSRDLRFELPSNLNIDHFNKRNLS